MAKGHAKALRDFEKCVVLQRAVLDRSIKYGKKDLDSRVSGVVQDLNRCLSKYWDWLDANG